MKNVKEMTELFKGGIKVFREDKEFRKECYIHWGKSALMGYGIGALTYDISRTIRKGK